MNLLKFLSILLVSTVATHASLAIKIGEPKTIGSKTAIKLIIKNSVAEKIDSARATVFLLNDGGKVVGQATHWVIGGSQDKPGLAAGATSTFHFIIANTTPFTTTNLTAKVSFTQIVTEGGRLADVRKEVTYEK